MNKKSLKEMFEFLPNANWISQDKGRNGLISIHVEKPSSVSNPRRVTCFRGLGQWTSNFDTMNNLDRKLIEIDWGNRKTWVTKCISRKEVMG